VDLPEGGTSGDQEGKRNEGQGQNIDTTVSRSKHTYIRTTSRRRGLEMQKGTLKKKKKPTRKMARRGSFWGPIAIIASGLLMAVCNQFVKLCLWL